MTTIIVPATDIKGEISLKQLDRCLGSINFPDFNEVMVCWDSCDEDFIDYFEGKYPIHSIKNEGNRLNFARNSNLGLRYVHQQLGDDVILLNQDCEVDEYLSHLTGEGIASAQSMEGDFHKDNIEHFKKGWESTRLTNNKVPFYCTFINKKVMDKIGYLDGSFIASFEDDNFCARSLLAGFPIDILNIMIFHAGTHASTAEGWTSESGSYNQERLNINLRKFAVQWQIPDQIPHSSMIEWILHNRKWDSSMRVD